MRIELYPATGKIETFDKDKYIISFADPTQEELNDINIPDIEDQITPEDIYIDKKFDELINILTTGYVFRRSK